MSTTSKTLAPIHLRSSLHPTIWGGRNLIRIAGKQLPEQEKIGESWETATDTVALNAPYTGQTLGALVEQYGEALIGAQAASVFGMRFPLLAKFIDAQDQLSVQVHPNDEYAAQHENGSLGKTEAWYILQADDSAEIVYGLKEQATEDEIRQAIAETRLEDYCGASRSTPAMSSSFPPERSMRSVRESCSTSCRSIPTSLIASTTTDASSPTASHASCTSSRASR